MACCIIAALLLAQASAMLRRWGIFWGLVRARPGEVGATVFDRLLAALRCPAVRGAVTMVALAELAIVAGWVYAEHGTHLYRLADAGFGRLRGERVIYADVCVPGRRDVAVRTVIAADGRVRIARVS